MFLLVLTITWNFINNFVFESGATNKNDLLFNTNRKNANTNAPSQKHIFFLTLIFGSEHMITRCIQVVFESPSFLRFSTGK